MGILSHPEQEREKYTNNPGAKGGVRPTQRRFNTNRRGKRKHDSWKSGVHRTDRGTIMILNWGAGCLAAFGGAGSTGIGAVLAYGILRVLTTLGFATLADFCRDLGVACQ